MTKHTISYLALCLAATLTACGSSDDKADNAKVDAQASEINSLSADVSSINADITALTAQLSALDVNEAPSAKMLSDLTDINTKLENLDKKTITTTQLSNISTAIQALEVSMLAKLADIANTQTAQTQQLTDLLEQNTALNSDMMEAFKQAQEKSDADQAALQAQLEALQTLIDDVKQQLIVDQIVALEPTEFTIEKSLGTVEFVNGTHMPMTVGFGSGAFHYPGDPAHIFYTVSDRGPNIACSDSVDLIGTDLCMGHASDKIFPMAEFTPTIYKMALNKFNGQDWTASILQEIPLKNAQGNLITGLPNDLMATDTEAAYSAQGEAIAFDPEGLDTEALVRLKDGSFWLTDEYGPSLVHVSADGKIIERVVPQSVAADLQDAGYTVTGGLPDILKKRKLNRGIESIAVTPDETFLYFIMQSPLANPDSAAYSASRTARLFKIALTHTGEIDAIVGEYTYTLDHPQTFGNGTQGDNSAKQSDVKISEMVAVAEDDLIILERISKTTKLYRTSVKDADNILGSKWDDIATTPALEASLEVATIASAVKQLALDNLSENINFPSKVEGIALLDDKHVLFINDNDFGIDGSATSIVILEAAQQLTQGTTPKAIQLTLAGRYASNLFGESAAEIVSYHHASQSTFVVNAAEQTVDQLSLSNLDTALANPTTASNLIKLASIDVAADVPSIMLGAANSVAIHDNLLAIAVEADVKQNPGIIAFYRLADDTGAATFIKYVVAGALPDNVIFSRDGSKVLVANEGEPSSDYKTDPEGSISVIAIADSIPADLAINIDFTDFNKVGSRYAELPETVRIFGPHATVAQDLEPEYITVSPDNKKAYVSLQENNAIAVIDLATNSIDAIWALGFKDYGKKGNEIDASDKDGMINFSTYANVYGMYQPDTIASYAHHNQTYIVTANEGDAREYIADATDEDTCLADGGMEFDDGDCIYYLEETRAEKADIDAAHTLLATQAGDKAMLGRLKITHTLGKVGDTDTYNALYNFGARSFSIWNAQGQQVFDSNSELEKLTAGLLGDDFNNNNDENKGDSRSDDKGPEPEALAIGEVNGRTYAFIGLERTGGIMVYDITNPYAPQFITFANNRDYSVNIEDDAAAAGDLAPEGMSFVPATLSPTGQALLIVGNEVSGSTSVYEIK